MAVEDPFARVVEPPDEEDAPESKEPGRAELDRLLAGKTLVTELPEFGGSLQVETQVSMTRRSWRYRTAVLRGGIETLEWPVKVEDRTRKIMDQELTDELRETFTMEALAFHNRRCEEVSRAAREELKEEPYRQRNSSPIKVFLMVLMFVLASVCGWLIAQHLASKGVSPATQSPRLSSQSSIQEGEVNGFSEDPPPAPLASVASDRERSAESFSSLSAQETPPSKPICSGDPDTLLREANEALLARDVVRALQGFEEAASCGGSYALQAAKVFDPSVPWLNRSIPPDPQAALHFYGLAITQGRYEESYHQLRRLMDWAAAYRPDDSALSKKIEVLLDGFDNH